MAGKMKQNQQVEAGEQVELELELTEEQGIPAPEAMESTEVYTEELPEYEGQDGEKVLFPGGPSLDQVEAWRSQYKDVYFTEFDDMEVFIWRPLIRKEYKDVMKIQNADNHYKEERICERVVLWPQNYGFMAMTQGKAGIPTLIAEQVLEKSGFHAQVGAKKL
jgi:hypothetical protein